MYNPYVVRVYQSRTHYICYTEKKNLLMILTKKPGAAEKRLPKKHQFYKKIKHGILTNNRYYNKRKIHVIRIFTYPLFNQLLFSRRYYSYAKR